MSRYVLTDLQKQRVEHCIHVMERVRDHYADKFNMKEWIRTVETSNEHECGTVACFVGWLGVTAEDGWAVQHHMPSYDTPAGNTMYGTNALAYYLRINAEDALLFAFENGYPIYNDGECADDIDIEYTARITPDMVIEKLKYFLTTGMVVDYAPEPLDSDDDE